MIAILAACDGGALAGAMIGLFAGVILTIAWRGK